MAQYRGQLPDAELAIRRPFELGLAAMAACQWDRAIGHLRSARARAGGAQLIPLCNQIGVCHYRQGRPDDALREFDEAARLATWHRDEVGRAPALGNIGVVLHDFGELAGALDALSEALARTRGDRAVTASCLGNIANIHHDQGELDQALQFNEEALATSRSNEDSSGVACALANTGSVHRDRGRLGKALRYYREALAIASDIGDRLAKASILGNIGTIHHYRGDLDQALQFNEEALALERETEHLAGVASALGNIGLILADKGLYRQAVPALTEALDMMLALGIAHGPRQALTGLSRCDDRLGRAGMPEMLKRAGLAEGSIADLLERIDQTRRRRPQPRSGRRIPFFLRRLAAGA